jgi:hypothetical protein
MRVGIASQVEPVACPLFSELRALQEIVNDPLKVVV